MREYFSKQLEALWLWHPTLMTVNAHRYLPKSEPFFNQERHHLNEISPIPFLPQPKYEYLDACEFIIRDDIHYQPLVRNSLALVCSLEIVFLRAGPKGKVYQGGDLDNRIKTFIDALRVPSLGVNGGLKARHIGDGSRI